MAFSLLAPFLILSLIILVASMWNFAEREVLEPIKEEMDSGYADRANVNVAYLYVHKESGELKVVSQPRKTPVQQHDDKSWEVIDIWWENPGEQ